MTNNIRFSLNILKANDSVHNSIVNNCPTMMTVLQGLCCIICVIQEEYNIKINYIFVLFNTAMKQRAEQAEPQPS